MGTTYFTVCVPGLAPSMTKMVPTVALQVVEGLSHFVAWDAFVFRWGMHGHDRDLAAAVVVLGKGLLSNAVAGP